MAFRKISLRPGMAALLLAGAGAAGVSGGVALADTPGRADVTAGVGVLAPPSAAVNRAGRHASLADMVEAVGPSVVQIETIPEARVRRMAAPFHGGGLDELFGGRAPERDPRAKKALGSGFIVDEAGVVITNNHVVDGAERVMVTLSDGRKLPGRVLGRDAKTDIAVVRIDGDGRFPAVAWGDSDRMRVGDDVFAVGSPFGLGNTVTAGIVSARGREIGAGPYDDFLQVDAAINSGNSGGPLFDAGGRVIGVNTAIFSPSGGNVGIGFAIPAQLARDIAQQIVAKGGVERGRVGVVLQDLTPDIVEGLGLADDQGALIADVEPAGPAARSGLASGDVVTRFAGQAIGDGRDFARAVAAAKAGSRVPVTVIRDGRAVELALRIGTDRAG